MPAIANSESEPINETYCCNDSCHRALARPVRYCPYCGTGQAGEQPNDRSKLGPASAAADVPNPPQPQVIPTIAVPAVSPQASEEEAKSSPQDAPDMPFGSSQIGGTLPASAPAIVKIQKHPSAVRLALFAVLFVTIALLLLRAVFHSEVEAPAIVQAVARPDQWTAVDIGELGIGTRLIVSGDGPFRIRTTSDAPILIAGGPIALGQIHRMGFEVKSANGRLVHITVQGSRDSHSRTSQTNRRFDNTAATANEAVAPLVLLSDTRT